MASIAKLAIRCCCLQLRQPTVMLPRSTWASTCPTPQSDVLMVWADRVVQAAHRRREVGDHRRRRARVLPNRCSQLLAHTRLDVATQLTKAFAVLRVPRVGNRGVSSADYASMGDRFRLRLRRATALRMTLIERSERSESLSRPEPVVCAGQVRRCAFDLPKERNAFEGLPREVYERLLHTGENSFLSAHPL